MRTVSIGLENIRTVVSVWALWRQVIAACFLRIQRAAQRARLKRYQESESVVNGKQ